MKSVLIYFLLIINLSSGVAFAWDSHPEAMVAGDRAAAQLLAGGDMGHDDPVHPGAADFDHCDHCCHGSAHLIGILYDNAPCLALNRHESGAFTALIPLSLYITPLLRPPIA